MIEKICQKIDHGQKLPFWPGLRGVLRRGVRADVQLSCTEARFQKCSQSSNTGSKHSMLSSPRAESARAVTGRLCPHSGEGEDFLTGQLDFGNERSLRGLQMGQ